MLFMVYEDSGSCIRAYCVPDDYTSVSKLSFFSRGQLVKTLEPNDFNEHMKGRHESGQVGFVVNESLIEGLSDLPDLEVRDVDTDIVVYRRVPTRPIIPLNIFRLETSLFPYWRLDASVKNDFRFWYQRIDMYSAETARQVLSFHTFGSIFASGRLLYQNYEFYLRETQKMMIVQDPFVELAERLLLFKRLGRKDVHALLGDRDVLIFEPAMEFAQGLDILDRKSLKRLFDGASPEALQALKDPISRQLTCATPDEPLDKNSIAHSLRCVSEFDIIGLRSSQGDFIDAFKETIGDNQRLVPHAPTNLEAEKLAEVLRSIVWIESLVEQDLDLYGYIKKAYEAV